MSVEDLMKMKPRDLQVWIATKIEQITDKELPKVVKRLDDGAKRFEDHEGRLIQLETERDTKEKLGINGWGSKKKTAAFGTGAAAVLVVIVNSVYQLGLHAGWWGG